MENILWSEIRIEEATMPWRVVLHNGGNPNEMVTHIETLSLERGGKFKHDGYHHGHYFKDCPDENRGAKSAIEDFLKRCEDKRIAPTFVEGAVEKQPDVALKHDGS
jgi:hypothetical protein